MQILHTHIQTHKHIIVCIQVVAANGGVLTLTTFPCAYPCGNGDGNKPKLENRSNCLHMNVNFHLWILTHVINLCKIHSASKWVYFRHDWQQTYKCWSACWSIETTVSEEISVCASCDGFLPVLSLNTGVKWQFWEEALNLILRDWHWKPDRFFCRGFRIIFCHQTLLQKYHCLFGKLSAPPTTNMSEEMQATSLTVRFREDFPIRNCTENIYLFLRFSTTFICKYK